MKKRFIVVVLDSFGVGAMKDVPEVRPQDVDANTAKHILELNKNIHFDKLIDLGLINAIGEEVSGYKMNPNSNFGKSNLAHYGGDTFYGHQEILGTKPFKPALQSLESVIEEVEADLKSEGFNVKRITKDGKEILSIEDRIFVGDNIETDPGQAMNVTGSLDLATFEEIEKVGRTVRRNVKVSRVIAFGGRGVTSQNMIDAIEVRNGYIGVDAPKSGVYKDHYNVIHLGYGVDSSVQIPEILHQVGVTSYLYGKVADICANPYGKLAPGVDTKAVFDDMLADMDKFDEGFFILNVQETDLAGHAQDPERYTDRLNVASQEIEEVIAKMNKEDILVVMADHGNDPTAATSKHSREQVPLLIYKEGLKGARIGERDTMADVGATAADFFGTETVFGTSFLSKLESK